jgi:hypothetical protein
MSQLLSVTVGALHVQPVDREAVCRNVSTPSPAPLPSTTPSAAYLCLQWQRIHHIHARSYTCMLLVVGLLDYVCILWVWCLGASGPSIEISWLARSILCGEPSHVLSHSPTCRRHKHIIETSLTQTGQVQSVEFVKAQSMASACCTFCVEHIRVRALSSEI